MLFGGFFMSKAKEKKEVTTNQGKKHLFGSSEKSDFILNMSAESAQKLCGVYIISHRISNTVWTKASTVLFI